MITIIKTYLLPKFLELFKWLAYNLNRMSSQVN